MHSIGRKAYKKSFAMDIPQHFEHIRFLNIGLLPLCDYIARDFFLSLKSVQNLCASWRTGFEFKQRQTYRVNQAPHCCTESLNSRNHIKGEVEAEKIFHKGFQEIYLATGDMVLKEKVIPNTEPFSYIKKILGKDPIW